MTRTLLVLAIQGRGGRGFILFGPHNHCEVVWTRIMIDNLFLRRSRPEKNTLLMVVVKYRLKSRLLKFQVQGYLMISRYPGLQ